MTTMARLTADPSFNNFVLWFDDILVTVFKVIVG